ncbi:hypothetical protein QQF64_019127, partial [Cirrhinus molitorella]
ENNLTAVVGVHDLKQRKRDSDRISVKTYYQHPNFTEIYSDFKKISMQNDIMLLR